MSFKPCMVIPHFNHSAEFAAFLPLLNNVDIPSIVIDDGSDAEHWRRVQSMLNDAKGVTLVRQPLNRGKGAAMMTGFALARAQGFTHVLQIDADGQHDVNDIENFIKRSQQHPDSVISGAPYFDDSAPKARVYGRRVTDFWVALETLSLSIKDSLCGFRMYPLQQAEQVMDRYYIGRRMDFDTDMIVKSVWLGIDVDFIPTKVDYPKGATSHFHYLRDNILLIRLHVRLMLGMLVQLPWIIGRKFRR